ncbi:hypothetical protein AVEN_243152-1 [Araneus ventricosus]|uniref:Uncharacterized protein n=1 Tax=Araneus ventricosus TaxID=182803 RepID=A0A4Y2N6D6_ARAVE|nr:hypothetical protein AVEN_243152-1 [Araneus ventricosus]
MEAAAIARVLRPESESLPPVGCTPLLYLQESLIRLLLIHHGAPPGREYNSCFFSLLKRGRTRGREKIAMVFHPSYATGKTYAGAVVILDTLMNCGVNGQGKIIWRHEKTVK